MYSCCSSAMHHKCIIGDGPLRGASGSDRSAACIVSGWGHSSGCLRWGTARLHAGAWMHACVRA